MYLYSVQKQIMKRWMVMHAMYQDDVHSKSSVSDATKKALTMQKFLTVEMIIMGWQEQQQQLTTLVAGR